MTVPGPTRVSSTLSIAVVIVFSWAGVLAGSRAPLCQLSVRSPVVYCSHRHGRVHVRCVRRCPGGTMKRRSFLQLAANAAALPFAPHIARAQAYPGHPIRLIVG